MTVASNNLGTFRIELIQLRQDRRPVDGTKVAALVASIRAIGLQTPPTVRLVSDDVGKNGIILVTGAHRLAALKNLGHEFVECFVLNDDVNAGLWEIDENLCRNELSPSQRAELTARRKRIYEELHPETAHGAIGGGHDQSRQVGDSAKVDRFTTDTAKATGQSERKIQRDAERGAKVCSEAIDLVRGTKLDTGAFLDKLKREDKADQVSFVQHELRDLAQPKKQPRKADPSISGEFVPIEEVKELKAKWRVERKKLKEVVERAEAIRADREDYARRLSEEVRQLREQVRDLQHELERASTCS